MDYTEYRVIFHIDKRSKWKLLLGNVENLLQAADSHEDCQSITVEVLANSEAVLEYAPARGAGSYSAQMAGLHQRGVTFAACRNAMKGNGLTETDLEDFVVAVPAGVMELVKRQAQGYGYIKP